MQGVVVDESHQEQPFQAKPKIFQAFPATLRKHSPSSSRLFETSGRGWNLINVWHRYCNFPGFINRCLGILIKEKESPSLRVGALTNLLTMSEIGNYLSASGILGFYRRSLGDIESVVMEQRRTLPF